MYEEYQELNLEPLLGPDKYVVFCKTEYEAQCLLAACKRSFPKKCEGWDLPFVSWFDREGKGQLYFPDINDAEGFGFSWNSVDFDEIDEYVVIEFESLLVCSADIEESEKPMSFLLEGLNEISN